MKTVAKIRSISSIREFSPFQLLRVYMAIGVDPFSVVGSAGRETTLARSATRPGGGGFASQTRPLASESPLRASSPRLLLKTKGAEIGGDYVVHTCQNQPLHETLLHSAHSEIVTERWKRMEHSLRLRRSELRRQTQKGEGRSPPLLLRDCVRSSTEP